MGQISKAGWLIKSTKLRHGYMHAHARQLMPPLLCLFSSSPGRCSVNACIAELFGTLLGSDFYSVQRVLWCDAQAALISASVADTHCTANCMSIFNINANFSTPYAAAC